MITVTQDYMEDHIKGATAHVYRTIQSSSMTQGSVWVFGGLLFIENSPYLAWVHRMVDETMQMVYLLDLK